MARRFWKYLRVCGEEESARVSDRLALEIPPRMRRRDARIVMVEPNQGNTSAYAEKSDLLGVALIGFGKYLRVCGEERLMNVQRAEIMEIPPRMRRRAVSAAAYRDTIGNTSAYAEKRR